ncbi:MAG: 3-phenylpropionate/trans-cinnamate dioxygenase ferredoxin reductase component [Pseudonocardiales bacterium]|nr:3-phenylpropionate/trans-cinnamate dioxygenase ferredoxin reductase component [Pseudonocardiales bacterium]
MSTPRSVVIAGAGLAGAKAAQTLREEGFGGRIVLLGAEGERPYERPPLSKEVLRGEADPDKAYVHDEGFYAANAIELRTDATVASIDTAGSAVVLAGGERLDYDRLLLATGARPRRLTLPGADLDGVCELRTLADSNALGERLRAGGRLAVVGAGWIGCEVAASARQMGLEVTVVEPLGLPLQRALGPVLGAFYRDLHAEHGVELLLGRGVTAFEGDTSVSAVRTDDGGSVACDVAVVGVGVIPRDEVAQRAGIATGDGILADACLQTSVPGFNAAGDVARAHHPLLGRSLRVEHWANALHQGPAAARNMLGARTPYDRLPYFFSDQYDVGMEYTGHAAQWDEVVIRGEVEAREFIAFWLHEGRVVAGMNVNVWDVTGDIGALIGAREAVDAGRLADPAVALGELLPAAAREA